MAMLEDMATELLKRAFTEAGDSLSEFEQDELGYWLLDAITNDDRRWDMLFSKSSRKLDDLERQAIADIEAGRAKPLDPDDL
jgi:hypothetical protein